MTTRDITSGLVTPIVIITATLSYAAMIFSGPLASKLPLGIGYGLVSAGIMAIVFALGSSMPFAIAGRIPSWLRFLPRLPASLSLTSRVAGMQRTPPLP